MNKFKKLVCLLPLLFRQFPQPGRGALVQFANSGEGTRKEGIKAYVADAATTARYLVYEQGISADTCKLALGVNEPLGPSDDLADANALDVPIAIKLISAFTGTTRGVSDGTVTNNVRVCVSKDGTGRLTVPAGGAGNYWVVGKAIIPSDANIVANDAFEFIPLGPSLAAY